MLDRQTLQAELIQLETSWTAISAGIAERQKEQEKIAQRSREISDDILRNQGALAFVKFRVETVTKQIEEIDKATVAAASSTAASPSAAAVAVAA